MATYPGNKCLFFVVLVLLCNNITIVTFSKKVDFESESESLRSDPPDFYKSFRSVNLFDDRVSDDNEDFIILGSLLDAFKGPRRKKRAIEMEGGFRPISYVYPESHFQLPLQTTTEQTTTQRTTSPPITYSENTQFKEVNYVDTRETPENLTNRDYSLEDNGYAMHYTQSEDPFKERYNKDAHLQQAMRNAWEEYGPKYNIRSDSSFPQEGRYNPSNYKNSFQEMASEWDQHVTAVPIPIRNRVILQPGIFNRLLSRYIDFEVNNHEIADFARKMVFGFFIATLIAGWIGLGLYLGFIPFKWLYFTGRAEDTEGKLFERRSDLLAGITDRIFLALDSDWLKKLEERVKMDSDRKWIKTHVHCCILPQSQTKGMADCRVIRRERKLSPYKCLSDLLYSFQFGPSVDEPKEVSNEARSGISQL